MRAPVRHLLAIVVPMIMIGSLAAWRYPELVQSIETSIPCGVYCGSAEDGSIIGGDQIQVQYLAWKLRQVVMQGQSWLSDPYNFAANGWMFYDMNVGPHLWIIAAFSSVFGDTVGYNLGFVFLPFLLMFPVAYWLLGTVSKSVTLRVFGAAAITLFEYRVVQILGGHGGGVASVFVVAYLAALILSRPGARGPSWSPWVGALALVFVHTNCEHQGYYLGLLSLVVFVTWWIQDLCTATPSQWLVRTRGFLWTHRAFALGAGAVIAFSLAFARVTLELDGVKHSSARGFSEIRHYSRNIHVYLGDTGLNIGSFILAGLALAASAVLILSLREKGGLSRLRSSMKQAFMSPLFPLLIFTPIAFILTMGIGDHWSQKSGLYELAYRNLPFFNLQRVATKFSTLTCILIVLVSAVVHSRLQFSARRFLRLASVGLLGCIVIQPLWYMAKYNRSTARVIMDDLTKGPQRIFEYLRTNGSIEDIIAPLPFVLDLSRHGTFHQFVAVQTNMRHANGYYGNPPSRFMDDLLPLSTLHTTFPSPLGLQVAKRIGITYFLADQARLESTPWPKTSWDDLKNRRFLKLVMCDGRHCLFQPDYAAMEPWSIVTPVGWIGDDLRGQPGFWTVKQPLPQELESLVDRSKFEVLAWLPIEGLPEGQTREVILRFNYRNNGPLHVIDPTRGTEVVFKPKDGMENEDDEARFSASSPGVFIGAKRTFRAGVKEGLEVGHFVYTVDGKLIGTPR